ncbi:MAG: hypothetical protein KJ727_09585 [Acidobacteria bacterium]|nr:hypothetical protein [Acidobacteriota bacterium]
MRGRNRLDSPAVLSRDAEHPVGDNFPVQFIKIVRLPGFPDMREIQLIFIEGDVQAQPF